MYEFTTELAAFAPPTVEQQTLFAALAGRQEEIDRFLGMLTGAVPLPEYFTPRNLLRVLGARGMAAVLLGKLRRSQRPNPRAGAGAQGPRLGWPVSLGYDRRQGLLGRICRKSLVRWIGVNPGPG
jgi:hypothetical protein